MLWYSFFSLYCKRIEQNRFVIYLFVYLLLINVYHDLLASTTTSLLLLLCSFLFVSYQLFLSYTYFQLKEERKLIEINTKQLNVVCWLVCVCLHGLILVLVLAILRIYLYLSIIYRSISLYVYVKQFVIVLRYSSFIRSCSCCRCWFLWFFINIDQKY